MSQALEIVTLQSIDDEIASANAAIADAEARIARDAAVEDAQSDLDAARASLRETQREQKRLEAEIARLNERIVPEEKRLYSGSVKSPKELSSIQHEVEHLKEQRTAFETELLAILERIDANEQQVRDQEKVLAGETARWDADKAELTARLAQLRRQVEAASTRRAEQADRVVAQSLQLYEVVRKKKGLAVARVQGQACGACRIGLPEAVRKRAMSPVMLSQCPSCDRILYVG